MCEKDQEGLGPAIRACHSGKTNGKGSSSTDDRCDMGTYAQKPRVAESSCLICADVGRPGDAKKSIYIKIDVEFESVILAQKSP